MPMSDCSISSATNRYLSGYPNCQLEEVKANTLITANNVSNVAHVSAPPMLVVGAEAAAALVAYGAALHMFHRIG
jgi:hypothetical protein